MIGGLVGGMGTITVGMAKGSREGLSVHGPEEVGDNSSEA